MIQFFILLIINSLICVGLYKSFQFEFKQLKQWSGDSTECLSEIDNDTKSIFWFWKFYVLDRIPYRLSKPLGNCLTCMASVYSFLPYWFYNDFAFTNLSVWFIYPFYILALAGLNSIFDTFMND